LLQQENATIHMQSQRFGFSLEDLWQDWDTKNYWFPFLVQVTHAFVFPKNKECLQKLKQGNDDTHILSIQNFSERILGPLKGPRILESIFLLSCHQTWLCCIFVCCEGLVSVFSWCRFVIFRCFWLTNWKINLDQLRNLHPHLPPALPQFLMKFPLLLILHQYLRLEVRKVLIFYDIIPLNSLKISLSTLSLVFISLSVLFDRSLKEKLMVNLIFLLL